MRNLATIGGNLATATPAGDLILGVAALDGKVKLRGPQGERELSLDEFLVGSQQTVAGARRADHRGGDPASRTGQSGSGFQKLGKRKAMTISTASAAASVVSRAPTAQTFEKVNVVLGSLGATVIHSTSFEEALRGKPAVLDEVGEGLLPRRRRCLSQPAGPAGERLVPLRSGGGAGAREPSKTRSRAPPARTSPHTGGEDQDGARVSRAPLYSMTPPGFPNPCAVNLQMREDGSVVVQIGVTEMGQGSHDGPHSDDRRGAGRPVRAGDGLPGRHRHDAVRFRDRELARHLRGRQRDAQSRRSGEGRPVRRGVGETGSPRREPGPRVWLRQGHLRPGAAYAHRGSGPVRPFRAQEAPHRLGLLLPQEQRLRGEHAG